MHKTKAILNTTSNTTQKKKVHLLQPPYCQSVQTNIGKLFLNLIDKHFKKSNEYYKIFNRKCIKISYSCPPNIKASINSHNKRILNKPPTDADPYNCRKKTDYPVRNQCLTKNTIQEAKITPENGDPKIYIGFTRKTFKANFNEHKNSFPKPCKTNPHCTQLANYLWDLRHNNTKYKVSWYILKKHQQ